MPFKKKKRQQLEADVKDHSYNNLYDLIKMNESNGESDMNYTHAPHLTPRIVHYLKPSKVRIE